MRSLPVQCGTIRIASVIGELRDIGVSGLTKARLLWLFRNFWILDFPVLNKNQQQLIAQVWHMGASAGSGDASPELIGTIEGFLPQPYQPPVRATRSRRHARFGFLSGLSVPAIWTAVGVLLLGGAIGLVPKHRWTPQFRVAAVVATNRVAAVAASDPVAAVAAINPVSSPVAIPVNISAEVVPSVAELPAVAAEASSLPAFHRPDAMAHDASSTEAEPLYSRPALRTKAAGKPEVMIRVGVDRQGRAHTFNIVQGDRKKVPAALAAARRWSFQPCSGSAECEHLLKFTDYGDASVVQIID